jgi:hypothetical protein
MELIESVEHLKIYYDAENSFLYCRWIGFQETRKIMDSGNRILAHVIERKVSHVLNDNREVKGPWQEAARWASSIWFPAMINAGLRYFAWILSPDIFAQISAEVAMNQTPGVCPFTKYEEARDWLITQH